MKQGLVILVCSVLVFGLVGCKSQQQKKDYGRPLGAGKLALVKVPASEVPDFSEACFNLVGLKHAAKRSINYLSKPSSKGFFPSGQISHEMAMESLQEFVNLLESGYSGYTLNAAIREKFDFYTSVGCDNEGTVLFTGYYTPIFDGSKTPSSKFMYPLYKQPADLVKGQDGVILGRKLADGSMGPYPARGAIESSNMLAGNELIWLSDPFEAYIAHVQGSAKIRLADGQLMTIGYAANNGHEYNSITKKMIEDGCLKSGQLNLSGMINYFKSHPGQVLSYLNENPRYVFFRLEDGSPRGSLNEPVTPYRSIATDKSIFPRGCLTFLSAYLPNEYGGHSDYRGFALDQDTGGAIRAPGRCDIYIGQGDQAGRIAGDVFQEGRLYYLFLKSY